MYLNLESNLELTSVVNIESRVHNLASKATLMVINLHSCLIICRVQGWSVDRSHSILLQDFYFGGMLQTM